MTLLFRQAERNDLPKLVNLLAHDILGNQREDVSTPLNPNYQAAFESISQDPNNELTVVIYQNKLVGMLQLTFIPYLTYIGSWRCLIEGVRISQDYRSQGFGEKMFSYAIARAKTKNCKLVQLTSDKKRPEAIRFYEKLGFVATHEGFKLAL